MFRRKPAEGAADSRHPEKVPLVSRTVYCAVCSKIQRFSTCWRRARMLRQCEECGFTFSAPEQLYRSHLPQCPQCGAYLEQPGFDYGQCDGCGSKFEIPEGAKPGLLPNAAQRAAMNKYGKSRVIE